MFDSGFKISCLGFTPAHPIDPNFKGVWKFSFTTGTTKYLADAEEYLHKIFIIQYYARKHKKCPDRCSLTTEEYRCSKIVATCIDIMLYLLNKDKNVSFGFIASPSIFLDTGQKESMDKNKRWRIYKHAMEGRMGTVTFTHAEKPTESRYLIINNEKDPDFILDEIERIFQSMYDK